MMPRRPAVFACAGGILALGLLGASPRAQDEPVLESRPMLLEQVAQIKRDLAGFDKIRR